MSWISDPSILWNKDYIYEIIPTNSMTYDQKINALTRLIILVTILLFLLKMTFSIIIIGIICLVSIHFFYKKEPFTIERILPHTNKLTMPTKENPLMNVLMSEYTTNPDRESAAPSYLPMIDKQIIENVKQQNEQGKDLYKGKFNQYQLDLSMRNFYTTANTTIPNKQTEFADFCYGDMISAKEGNNFALSRQHPRIGGVIN